MDIDALLDEFLLYLSINRGLSDNTVEAYAKDLEAFSKFFKNRSLSSKNILEFAEKHYEQKHYKTSTINRKLSSLRTFLKFLSHTQGLDADYDVIKNIKHRRKPPEYIGFDRIKSLFSHDRDGLIVLFMYAAGLRVSELCGLKISDIMFDAGFVRVFGKSSKERIVPVDRRTLEFIEIYIKTERIKYADKHSSDFLFLSKSGKKLSRYAVWKIVKKKFLSIGIDAHPHALRHLFATHMIENGASLRSVQEMLGHESVTTTQIYTDISDSALENEFHKLEILK